jgi:CRP-like cAMP-binding protein
MPVTARLSQKFYERLGEDVANELVDWFNAVDATYRNDLRELNELNFQRFDAKVEQRFAQADARWEQRFAELRVEIERRFAETKTEFATIRSALADQRADVVRWMFRFWIGTLVPLAGLIVALRVL